MTHKLRFMQPWLDEFLIRSQAENLSPATILWYRERLEKILAFLEEEGAREIHDITAAQIRAFAVHEQKRGLKPRSINGCLRSLKAMLNYFIGEEVLDASPMKRVRLVREPKALIAVYSEEQMERLLFPRRSAGFLDLRDLTLLRFLYDTGVRAAEICSLQVSHVDLEERTALVTGKGRKERRVPLGLSLTKQLFRYLRERARELGGDACPYLFFSRFHKKLTPSGIRQIVERCSRAAGIEGVRTSPHTLRHSFAKAHVLNGGDAFSLQAMLGHADIASTQKYVGLNEREVRRQHDAFGPLDRLRESHSNN